MDWAIFSFPFPRVLIRHIASFLKLVIMWLRAAVGVTSGTLVCLKAIPHIFPQLYYKRIKELKIDGREMEIPPRCREQLAGISQKLGMSDKQDKISFFVCRSLYPSSSGATWLPNGAVIGVPLSFYFKHEDDLGRFGEICFQDGKVPMLLQSRFGQKFIHTQLSSDDNIAFCIGRELVQLSSSFDIASDVFFAPSWLIATYAISRRTRIVIPRASALVDGIVKVTLYLLSFACFWPVERRLNHYREFKADEMSARCDLDVAKGGVDWVLKKKRFLSLMKSIQGGHESKEMLFNTVDSTHPKLLDRLRRLEVIVDEKIKGAR